MTGSRSWTGTRSSSDQLDVCLQEFNKLLDRVRAAKAETEKALQGVGTNKDLDDTLNTLRGTDTRRQQGAPWDLFHQTVPPVMVVEHPEPSSIWYQGADLLPLRTKQNQSEPVRTSGPVGSPPPVDLGLFLTRLFAPPGFDQQIGDSKAESDEAVKRLPNINSTIQEAVGKNGEAQSVLDAASKDHDEAMGNINTLDDLAKNLQVKTAVRF